MEHEDNNTQLDNNYLRGTFDEFSLQQNQQNLVENLQIASGFGAGGIGGIGGVVEEIGVSIGGKFEEEEHDEEEWKYIKEVQQSEKQTLKAGEGVGVGVEEVGGVIEDEDGEQLLQPQEVDEEEEAAIIKMDGDFSTTSNTTSTTAGEEENSAASVSASAEPQSNLLQEEDDEEERQHHQHQHHDYHDDDDDDDHHHHQLQHQAMDEKAPMLQMEMEIETQLQPQENNSPTSIEESSLATNSSNSGVENCENVQQQQQQQPYFGEELETQAEQIGDCVFTSTSLAQSSGEHDEYKCEADKENADPALLAETAVAAAAAAVADFLDDASTNAEQPPPARPTDLDFEMHSNLNPEAKEFVPTFSNPASPASPMENDFPHFGVGGGAEIQANLADHASPPVADFSFDDDNDNKENFGNNDFVADVVGEPAPAQSTSDSPHPTAVPRHMIGVDDDFVAQSPRKGRGSNMDAISLPAEIEFEHEAAKRPHEIEQEDDLIGDGNTEADLLAEENGEDMCEEGIAAVAGDMTGNHLEMPLAAETAAVAQDCPDFMNPSPVSSLIDHGPETCVDLDMDSQDAMKQSMYIENVQDAVAPEESDQPIEELLNTVQPIPNDSESINNSFAEDLQPNSMEIPNKELLNVEEKEVISHSPSTEEIQMQFQNEFNASNRDIPAIPMDMDNAAHMQESFYMEHTSLEPTTTSHDETPAQAPAAVVAEQEVLPQLEESLLMDTTNPLETNESIIEEHSFAAETAPPAAAPEDLLFADFTNEKVPSELVTPSPQSTEEKHLMEETKEYLNNGLDELEQKMGDMLLENDGYLHKVEEVAQSATTINEEHISPFTYEAEALSAASPSPAPSPLPELMDLHQQKHHDNEPVFEAEPLQPQSPSPVLYKEHMEEMLQQHDASIEEPEIIAAEASILELSAAAPNLPTEDAFSTNFMETITNSDPLIECVKMDAAPEEEPKVITVEEPIPETTAPAVPTETETPAVPTESVTPDVPTKTVTPDVPTETVTPAAPAEDAVSTEMVAATIAATAAVAATAAAAGVAAAASGPKKPEPIRRPTPGKVTATAAKSKVGVETKKPTETKKPATAASRPSVTAARPRPGATPARTATTGSAEKKNITSTGAVKPTSGATTTTARKPLSTSTAAKPAASAGPKTTTTTTRPSPAGSKPSTAGAARNGVAAKSTAARPTTATSTTARKPLTSTAATTHGTTAKPRPATAGATPAAKSSTLGISAKPKVALSPRATLSSQLRKSGPTATSTATAAKSPTKPAATTNGIGKAAPATSLANRTKTSTTTTKTFTARPAPKTTSSNLTTTTTTTTTRRTTNGGTTSAGATRTSSTLLRKSSPSKPTSMSGKVSPTKPAAITRNKTKDAPKTATAVGTGAAADALLKEKQLLNAQVELEPPKTNGNACAGEEHEPLEHIIGNGENGTHAEENGLIEQAEMALMGGTAA